MDIVTVAYSLSEILGQEIFQLSILRILEYVQWNILSIEPKYEYKIHIFQIHLIHVE